MTTWTETPSVTLYQKEENKNYILSHLNEYVVDVHGNFFNIDPEMLGEGENARFCYIGKESLTPQDYEEIREKFGETILQEIKDWELDINEVGGIENFRHKESRRKIHRLGLSTKYDYQIIGELGYRENIWENYEQVKKEKEERDKEWEKYWKEITSSSNKQILHYETNSETSEQNPTPKKQPTNSDNPSPNQVKRDQPTEPTNKNNPSLPPQPNQKSNSPLPSNTEVQSHYNSDQAKSVIDNNPDLTDSEQKELAQEILKLIITAELLVKEQKFNPDTLTKLVQEREQNTPSYQLLNKNNRVDKAVEALEKAQKKSTAKDNTIPSLTTNLLIGGGIVTLISVFLILIIKKKNNYLKK
jgi:hypothetical protein